MATIPSISLIPSGYKAGKVYSVLPTDGSGDLTFARASTATRINKNNLIENVGNNVPRLDYEGGGCPSLLLEPSSTNLITYSEDLTNWNQSGVSIISNSAISPDGTLNADKITATSVDPSPYIEANVTATEHTFSFYYKGEGNSIGKQARVLFWFIGTATGTTTSVNFTLTGDWQRFESQITPTGAGTLALRIDFPSDVAVVGDYGYLWGAQLEEGSYPTSYIPTSGSTQTRLADTANGSGNASTFNDSEGVLMAEISALGDTVTTYNSIGLGNNSAFNRIGLGFQAPSDIYVFKHDGSNNWLPFQTIDINSLNKVALSYKTNDNHFWINGFKIASNTTIGDASNLDELEFKASYGLEQFYGNTKQLQYFDTALTDSELETLTSYSSFNEMALAQNYIIQ